MTGIRSTGDRRVFVDTSAYYGLVDRTDNNHPDAVTISNQLTAGRYHQLTTEFVIAELHALVLGRLGRDTALKVLDELEQSSTEIISVTHSDLSRAREIIRTYRDKDFSLTDAISFAVIERLAIPVAHSFDKHFVQFGLQVLSP